jgi:hypothetical protein
MKVEDVMSGFESLVKAIQAVDADKLRRVKP